MGNDVIKMWWVVGWQENIQAQLRHFQRRCFLIAPFAASGLLQLCWMNSSLNSCFRSFNTFVHSSFCINAMLTKFLILSDDEKKLITEVFVNAIDSLSDEDKKLPQVRKIDVYRMTDHWHYALLAPGLEIVMEGLYITDIHFVGSDNYCRNICDV